MENTVDKLGLSYKELYVLYLYSENYIFLSFAFFFFRHLLKSSWKLISSEVHSEAVKIFIE